MKKFTRLLKPKSKKTKDSTRYNVFGENVATAATTITTTSRNTRCNKIAQPLPLVHNYGQETKQKTPTTSSATTAVATSKKKSKAHKLQLKTKQESVQQSTRLSDDNNINYTSLNRIRNKRNNNNNNDCNNGSGSTRDACLQKQKQQKRQRKKMWRKWKWWRRYFCCGNRSCFDCCCCCCKTKRQYNTQYNKGYWQQRSAGVGVTATGSSTSKNKHCRWLWRWRHWCIWGLCCFCCKPRSRYQYDSEEDDDIDGKFAAYIYEMQQKDVAAAKETSAAVVTGLTHTKSTPNFNSCLGYATQSDNSGTALLSSASISTSNIAQDINSEVLHDACAKNTLTKQTAAHCTLPNCTGTVNISFRRRSRSETKPKRRAWTWDDSLRSNSDRFLETLEEDDLNLPVAITRMRRPALQVFIAPNGEEAKAAAEELPLSPVVGVKQHDPASSPLQSRGSTSSDAWPAQSDEDIDRLVALHQNRSSLSSLGLRSDSMASVYSGAGEGRYGTVVVKGQVEFGMQYNYKLGALEIHVVRCKDLAAVDAKRNRSDPYVKVYLLPDKSKAGKRKTKVKKHTLNPIFDEVLRFQTPISSLESRTLWLTVWHSDMFGRNDFLGEVSVSLQGRVFDNPQSQWYLLQERSEPFDEVATYRGDIVVGLKYVPPENIRPGFQRGNSLTGSGTNIRKFGSIKSVASKTDRSAKGGQLHVLVKEAKHLSAVKTNGSCDAFCKSYLLPDRTRNSKQKTPVVKRSTHPSWNYTFIYEDISLEDLSERALELTVWDHDRLASNEFLGGIRFSLGTGKSYGRQVDWMDASGKELSLWQNMLDRPNFWVEGSLTLRSTLDGVRAIT